MFSEETGVAFILGRSECRELLEELDKIGMEALRDFQFPILQQMQAELVHRGYAEKRGTMVTLSEAERT